MSANNDDQNDDDHQEGYPTKLHETYSTLCINLRVYFCQYTA
jgi:hypothetical protein